MQLKQSLLSRQRRSSNLRGQLAGKRALRRFSLLGCTGLLLWACATSEALDSNSETGGRATTGGRSGLGGASASGGRSTSGGTSSTSGGATSSAGGSTSGGNTSGGAQSSASGGTPSSVIERASAIVHYQTDQTAATSSKVFMHLFIENKSSDPLPLADVSVRYWMTSEAGSVDAHADYQAPSIRGEALRFVDDGELSYIEVKFSGNTISKGADLGTSEFQVRLEAGGGSQFDQTNDYSFDASATSRKPNDKITLYLASKLIWGCEPNGTCPDFGGGGAGGAGGAGGVGGEPSTGGVPSTGGEPGNAGAAGALNEGGAGGFVGVPEAGQSGVAGASN